MSMPNGIIQKRFLPKNYNSFLKSVYSSIVVFHLHKVFGHIAETEGDKGAPPCSAKGLHGCLEIIVGPLVLLQFEEATTQIIQSNSTGNPNTSAK